MQSSASAGSPRSTDPGAGYAVDAEAGSAAARCLRDVVALSALSAFWVDRPPEEIARGLAEALGRVGGSLVFVRIPRTGDVDEPFQCAVVGGRPASARELQGIAAALEPQIQRPHSSGPISEPDPQGAGTRQVVVMPLGVSGSQGVVVVAARDFDLPPTMTRMLVGVAANQAATALVSARLNGERTALMGRLERLASDLSKANAVKDELLGLVSHELRTPLTTILGMAEVLRSRVAGDAVLAEALEDICGEADRLERLVENMLVLARVEAAPEPTLEPILLQRLLPPQIEAVRRRHPGRSITFEVARDLHPVMAQPTYVEQIVHNLLTNAAKYSDPSMPIELVAHQAGPSAVVRVRDRGHPIAPDELQRLFEPFFRSTRSTHVSGAGLGLAVCKRLVEAQSGSIWARAREGGGLELGFSLGLLEDDVEPDGPIESTVTAAVAQ